VADHAPVPYLSPAVQRGFGFFETALLVGRRAILWDPHLDRLLKALARLELPAPSREAMDAAAGRAVDGLAPRAELQSGLRLTWLAAGDDVEDASSWRLDAYVIPIPESRLARRDGSRAVSLPLDLQRDTPEVKSTSYFAAIQGGRLAKKAGADEGLFRGHDGRYLEGTTTGLAAWNGGTPERHGRRVLRRTGRGGPDRRE
jgi:4-amino-4-deoxychorismate lyase